ncbi:MAG: SWIM zinc finger family protein [Patescibacteria group bacterium]|jgi:hypothetical protein
MKFSYSLSHYILENTTEAIFWRGVEYFKTGKINDLIETDKKVNAVVKGSKLYNVEFRLGQKYIKGYCNCPYFQSNSDYCKHIVAVAAARDAKFGFKLPIHDEVASGSLQIDYGFGQKVNEMFSNPLRADLQFLAEASDSGDWVRPHAKLPLGSRVKEIAEPMKIKEIISTFEKIEKLSNRANYDPYFCAGEISSILSSTYDTIRNRLRFNQTGEAILIIEESIKFYYNVYLNMIDGSDGIWVIPQARLKAMIKFLLRSGMSKEKILQFGQALNKKIDGWGNILEDIDVKTSELK